jgi:hypothetical protein
MDNLPDNLGNHHDSEAPSVASAARFVGGIVLMLVGVATMVGGIILHFAVKAERVDLFPYAGRFVILLGLVIAIVAMVMAGWRAAIWAGSVVIAVGVVMLVYGYANLEEPSLRFYAPLGFFIALAGGFLVWGGRFFRDEARKLAAADESGPTA